MLNSGSEVSCCADFTFICISSFVRENVECKESLVSSACGEDTGKLAFHILRLDAVKDMNKKSCIITRKSNYESEYLRLSSHHMLGVSIRQQFHGWVEAVTKYFPKWSCANKMTGHGSCACLSLCHHPPKHWHGNWKLSGQLAFWKPRQ